MKMCPCKARKVLSLIQKISRFRTKCIYCSIKPHFVHWLQHADPKQWPYSIIPEMLNSIEGVRNSGQKRRYMNFFNEIISCSYFVLYFTCVNYKSTFSFMLYAQFCACLFLLLILTLQVYSIIAHIKGLTHQDTDVYIPCVCIFWQCVYAYVQTMIFCFLSGFFIFLFVQQLFQKIDTNKDKKTRNNKKWVLFPVT